LEYLDGIFLPPEYYFTADFLLDEWIELLPKKKFKKKRHQPS